MSISLKDLIVNSSVDLLSSFTKLVDSMRLYKTRALMSIVKQFNKASIIEKRRTIIDLLIFKSESDFEYIAYLLYEQALIQEGVKLEDPSGFVNRLNNVIKETL